MTNLFHDGNACARLVAALAASLLLHAWLMHGYGERRRSRPAVAGSPLHATLSGAPAQQSMVVTKPAGSTLQLDETPPAPRAASTPPLKQSPSVPHGAQTDRMAPAPTQMSALPQPQDPTYYSARSLDEFPARLTPLNLAMIRTVAQDAGSARATLLIDEAGTVNEVAAIEGLTHTNAEQAIRELFLSARFSPARKDGRAVKARVLVNVSY